jgi:hypothetical protein
MSLESLEIISKLWQHPSEFGEFGDEFGEFGDYLQTLATSI